MKHIIFSFIIGFFCTSLVNAQELNCQVSIITNNKLPITTFDQENLKQLQGVIYEFMNNTKWTKDHFEVEERINCQIQIQINEAKDGVFSGMMQVQSSRPAYNSSYNSLMFNFQDDKLSFNYSRNALLVYAPNQFRDNLTSILAFYAYYIIGMDYDSFSEKGGTTYFTEAQNIVMNAQSSGFPGWSSGETGLKNNRYWLIDNQLHQLFEPLRLCFYTYHRNGIDKLYEDKERARTSIFESLNSLVKVVATRPGYINLVNFCQAKMVELKNLYAEADTAEKTKIVTLLKRLDPANASKYDTILG